MDVFTVSLFGHRRIDDIRIIYDRLVLIIENLILTKSYIEFFIGRNGVEFVGFMENDFSTLQYIIVFVSGN